MALHKTRIARFLWLAATIASLGCGSYVKYHGQDPTQGGPPEDGGGLPVELAKTGRFDHSLLTGILAEHVSIDGRQATLDYAGMTGSPTTMAALGSYRAALATADPAALQGQAERLSFWLNAYNASVIAGVLSEYAGRSDYSVNDSGTFFNARRYRVAGLTLSLDEVEHGAVRGVWDHASVAGSPSEGPLRAWHTALWGADGVDARIHVALNCGALSCPNLQQMAWQPATLPEDLQAALEVFLDDPVKGAGPNGVSLLFTWFKPDFESDQGGVEAFIEKNRKGGLVGVDTGKMLTYDWALNIRR